jgi:autotransporter-associated beta strand protein
MPPTRHYANQIAPSRLETTWGKQDQLGNEVFLTRCRKRRFYTVVQEMHLHPAIPAQTRFPSIHNPLLLMKPTSTLRLFLLAAGSSLLAISSASAQSWDGSSSGAWLDGTNWGGDVAAGSTASSDTDIAVFNVNANNTIGINMTTTGGNYYLGAIDNTNSAARTITNTSGTTGILTLNSATVNSVANTIIRNSTGGSLTIRNDNTSGTLGLALAGSSNVIQITSNGAVTINSNISGSGGITRQGAGTAFLNLTGNNSYTGVTAITAGAIAISSNNALGSSAAGANNTTIAATGATNGPRLLISGTISSAENITLTGTTEQNQYIGAIINTANTNTLSGNITLDGSAGLKISATGGTLNLTGNITQQTGKTNALVLQPLAGTAVINVSNAIAINGGELLIVGANGTAGALATLSGVSGSGIGQTTIGQRATLRLGVSNALNTSQNLIVSYGGTAAGEDMATFDLRGFNQTINALNGTGGSANASTNANRVVTNGAASGTSIFTVGNGGGSGTFNGQINNGATASIQLIKTGAGNQTLNDTNSYTGGTRIDGGTLTLGHATNTLADTGAVNVNGGTLALGTRTDTVGAVTLTSGNITGSGTGALTGTGSAYDVRSGSVSAILGGSVGLTKSTAGTVTLTGTNTYSGATQINAGTLAVNGGGSINNSAVTVNGGTFLYNSSVAYSGGLTFTSGTIAGTNLTGSLGNQIIGAGKTISPGNSPGTMATTDQTWANDGSYLWEINNITGTVGTDPGWDFLSGTGALSITATSVNPFDILITSLTLGNLAGNAVNFNNASNYNWMIADFSSISGFDVSDFSLLTGGFSNTFTGNFGISLGGVGAVPGDSSQIYLTYTAIPEPGAALIGSLGLLALLRRRR